MRKILAVLLAVMMLASVLAVLPVSAETYQPYDGSTATSVGEPELIITEIAQRAHGGTGNKSYDSAAGFVEVFNNTAASVDFSTLSLLRALNFEKEPDLTDPLYDYYGYWVFDKLFLQKMDIEPGVIVKDRNAYASIFTDDTTMNQIFNSLENSANDLTVESGKAAVIWFITETTVEWLKEEYGKSVSAYDPREIYAKKYYGSDAQASDYNIIMVWAPTNMISYEEIATDMFTWELLDNDEDNKSIIIALADDTWDLATDNCKTVNDKIKSMAVIGNLVVGYAKAGNNFSAVFAPATTEPFLMNKEIAFRGDNTTKYADYVAAGLAKSYVEVGAVFWNALKPTPGKLPDWQYAMMADVLNVALPAGLDIDATLKAFYDSEGYGDDDSGNSETKKEHNYVDREELENLFSGANQDDDEGGNKLIIFIIIGAVVLVLAAVAVVLFVVILPKKKAAAAAAASEDAPVEDAPVEAPVEEAPAEEKTEE